MVKSVGKYDLYKTLGQGSFGKVKYAVNRETNEAVAIKILDKDKIQKKNMGAQIKKEISIMKMISHKQVVSVKDVFATATKIFIVLELVEGGELFDKIANDGKLPEDQARFYFKQLLEGLEYCHSNGVCHRDLKPENLLLDSDGNIKISDFGLATLYIGDATAEGSSNRTELLHTTCGTPNYVAPEVLSNQGYDGRSADIWSIGVILYVLLAGFLPFEEKTIAALFSKIKAADYSYPSWFSADAKSLLDGILVANPAKRFTLEQVKNHSWTKGVVTNPKFPTRSSIDFRKEYTTEENSSHGVDTEEKVSPQAMVSSAPSSDESNNNSGPSYRNQQPLLPPPPPKSPSQGRGSFLNGIGNEQVAVLSTSTPASGSNLSSNNLNVAARNQANRTARAPPNKSVFSCFCTPFTAFQDLDNYSGDATSPQGSPARGVSGNVGSGRSVPVS